MLAWAVGFRELEPLKMIRDGLAPELLGAAFHHPAHRVNDVDFTASAGPDDRREVGR